MNRKRALVVGALLGCFLLGCLVGGAVVFFRTAAPMGQILALDDLTRAGSEAYVKYRYGSYPVAKAALLQHVERLMRVGPHGNLLGESTVAFDLGLTYGRLAVLAERAGQAEDAARYMSLATQSLAKRGQPVDAGQVRVSVDRLDAAWDARLGAGAHETR